MFNPQCHTGPPLRFAPVIRCKDTKFFRILQVLGLKSAVTHGTCPHGLLFFGIFFGKIEINPYFCSNNFKFTQLWQDMQEFNQVLAFTT